MLEKGKTEKHFRAGSMCYIPAVGDATSVEKKRAVTRRLMNAEVIELLNGMLEKEKTEKHSEQIHFCCT